jgi:hypothetical protein
MPLVSNYILHTWTKDSAHNQGTDRMPTEPEKHYLLGFPGVEAEHRKLYIRRLWLVADNDRKAFPKFLDKDVEELAKQVNKVVNTFVRNEDKRHEELCGGIAKAPPVAGTGRPSCLSLVATSNIVSFSLFHATVYTGLLHRRAWPRDADPLRLQSEAMRRR